MVNKQYFAQTKEVLAMIGVPASSAFRTLGLVVLSLLYALNMQPDRTESSILSIENKFFFLHTGLIKI